MRGAGLQSPKHGCPTHNPGFAAYRVSGLGDLTELRRFGFQVSVPESDEASTGSAVNQTWPGEATLGTKLWGTAARPEEDVPVHDISRTETMTQPSNAKEEEKEEGSKRFRTIRIVH